LVDLAEIQAAYYMVAATGVLVAAIYYVMTLRTTQKNVKATLETRQAQLYMAIYQDLTSSETVRKSIDILNMEWSDYDDFERKYGSDYNIDSYVTRYSYQQKMSSIGWLVKSGLIDSVWLFELYGWYIIWVFRKVEPIIREQERRYSSDIFMWYRYLYEEMVRISEQRGRPVKVPEKFAKYVPD